MRRHFYGMVDASAVMSDKRASCDADSHETKLKPLQKKNSNIVLLFSMSFLATRCPVGCVTVSMLRSAVVTNYSGLRVFLSFYCHTIALMSKVLQQHSMKLFSQIDTRFPCVKLSLPNFYNGSPHTSQSFPLFVFSNVQCGHTRTLADGRPLPWAGVATSSNNSGGMSSSMLRVGGASGAGCAGRCAVV
jgi:hypothetical protein